MNFWDAEKGVKAEFGTHYKELVGFKAAEDSRKLTLPGKPEDLALELPSDFVAPQGVEFVPNENDPIVPQAKAFALKHGLTKDAWKELVGLKAAMEIGTKQLIDNAKAAEVQKLGVNGTARVTAVNTFIASIPGVSGELAKTFSRFNYTAAQVEVIEKVMAHMRNQGVGGYSRAHTEPELPNRLSDAEIEKMSFGERRAYAAKFPQPAMSP